MVKFVIERGIRKTMLVPRTVPAPFVVAPTWQWDGNDGNWTTFGIKIGTPAQSFRVLPSTSGAETWVPIPAGCDGTLAGVSNCGTLRGIDNYDGSPSKGFETNNSSSWKTIGIYELSAEQNLFGADNNTGIYGTDSLSLDALPSGSSPQLSSQTIAGITTGDFWLGSLGLGIASANFSTESSLIPSMMSTLKNQSVIPSLSYGYTAGAHYSSNKTPGSLVLGGYDQARFTPSNSSFPLSGDQNQTLSIGIKSIIVANGLSATYASMQIDTITATIDSAVTELWLPQLTCDTFADAFGLTYDTTTELYTVNSTTHSELLQRNPSITFTVQSVNTADAGSTYTTIVLPYSAFDLYAGIPIYNESTPYFPIRVAANESQQVIGRTFLQEAYVFVDWERGNFTLGQAIHQSSASNIVPVQPPSSSPASGTSFSSGAIAGAVVGALAIVALVVGIVLFCLFHKRRQQRKAEAEAEAKTADTYSDDQKANELHGDHVVPAEIMSRQVHELHEGDNTKTEIMSTPVTELPGSRVEKEMDGTPTIGTPRPPDYADDVAKRGVGYEASEPAQTQRYELP